LPFDSTLVFVLDDPISSKASKTGHLVRVHLKDPLVVGGHVVAQAGTPAQVRIVDTSSADIADTYGFVDIFFEPLLLADGRSLPLRAPISRLEPHRSSGHESTVAAEDTVGDIFVPYYSFYQIFRQGKNFVLNPGSEIPARTEATLSLRPNGSIAIVTPRPLSAAGDVPNPSFPVMPMATPIGGNYSAPHGADSRPLAPATTPSPSPSPSPSATASAKP
jgi:hypothetical protein